MSAARANPAPEEVDKGSGPPAGSSADAGKPGRLTAPVRAGQDRMDRAACELAPSAAGRAGIVCETAGRGAAGALPSKPVEAPAGPWTPGPPRDPVPEPGSPGSGGSPSGTTGETSPPTAPATGTSADPTGTSADPTGASTGPSGRTTAPVTGPTSLGHRRGDPGHRSQNATAGLGDPANRAAGGFRGGGTGWGCDPADRGGDRRGAPLDGRGGRGTGRAGRRPRVRRDGLAGRVGGLADR